MLRAVVLYAGSFLLGFGCASMGFPVIKSGQVILPNLLGLLVIIFLWNILVNVIFER